MILIFFFLFLRFLFSQEQFDLFRWRKDYFYSQFGTIYEGDVWFTNGGDDTHIFEVHPYQVYDFTLS